MTPQQRQWIWHMMLSSFGLGALVGGIVALGISATVQNGFLLAIGVVLLTWDYLIKPVGVGFWPSTIQPIDGDPDDKR